MPSVPNLDPDHQSGSNGEQTVLGIDTHGDAYVAAIITPLGMQVASASFPTIAAGYHDLLAWAQGFGILHHAGVEGNGSYGADVARYLRG